ncbi:MULTISPECIES: LPXTG cell wall anchor domain-containing protein [unclassified Collinsella]|uniref:LPXTG cell wall anchor domain-containing protein n=1 Tax=unclassified Collinsella TaxID=2637548 RepID=UPI000E48625B|nr:MULTISPECIES: LPXTG cell wall anchor domain-containing protein [unclassified Collinsella]RGT45213.1 LPXTG cell wall anchor domain-containing protein [Collinsella sp. AF18-8LB]RGT50177.1 LPXTG cell wall anchor domain-containing protein [Collinsella sp. AF18-8]
MNDILARRARRATVGIALSAALVAGIAPATAIAAETSSPTGAAVSQTSAANGNSGAPQTEDAAAAKEKAYAAMQEALKNLEAAKDAASPEKLAEIDDDIASFQEIHDMVVTEAAKRREPLPAMQANVDAAQAKYDEAHNRTSGLQAELNKAIDDGASNETIKQLRSKIMSAERREKSCEDDLHRCQRRLESQEREVQCFESEAEKAKAHIDEDVAKRDTLLDDLEKAQAAYDDACKAYEEAKAAADKATSPEITKPTETVPPSGSAQPAETAPPVSSPATGKDTLPSSTKQANSSSGKQANTTAGKLANTGDTAPSAIALAGIAAAGLGITTAATRRIKNSK